MPFTQQARVRSRADPCNFLFCWRGTSRVRLAVLCVKLLRYWARQFDRTAALKNPRQIPHLVIWLVRFADLNSGFTLALIVILMEFDFSRPPLFKVRISISLWHASDWSKYRNIIYLQLIMEKIERKRSLEHKICKIFFEIQWSEGLFKAKWRHKDFYVQTPVAFIKMNLLSLLYRRF